MTVAKNSSAQMIQRKPEILKERSAAAGVLEVESVIHEWFIDGMGLPGTNDLTVITAKSPRRFHPEGTLQFSL